MILDKFKAIKGYYRIPEVYLLSLGLIGGGFIGIITMILLRHKIRKLSFWLVYGLGILGYFLIGEGLL